MQMTLSLLQTLWENVSYTADLKGGYGKEGA